MTLAIEYEGKIIFILHYDKKTFVFAWCILLTNDQGCSLYQCFQTKQSWYQQGNYPIVKTTYLIYCISFLLKRLRCTVGVLKYKFILKSLFKNAKYILWNISLYFDFHISTIVFYVKQKLCLLDLDKSIPISIFDSFQYQIVVVNRYL